MTASPGQVSRPQRALARMYDQHLRLLAAHYNNMHEGRSSSAHYLASYFYELVALTEPALFVEAGAYKGEVSRRVKREQPSCRVVAFEANPHNYERYAAEIRADAPGVEYRNLAVTDVAGPVDFHLRTQADGEMLRAVTGNSSLLRREDPATEYELLSVEGITLDGFFTDHPDGPVCMWIDVEGASGKVLRGATELLRRTEVVLIEVEESSTWEGQWRSIDVIEFFLDAGFVPLTRDAEYNQQYNIIFVRADVYERPAVLWSHELHTNYLTQHMGVRR